MRTLAVDRLLGCLEELLQLGTWSPPSESQHEIGANWVKLRTHWTG